MPSSPKISKETILEHALQMLIREGYAALNIKALAKEIGLSTQPISRHFGSMDGLRTALSKYALLYATRKQAPVSSGMQAFYDSGVAYVNIAFDEPNLFKYLYMSTDSGYIINGFDALTVKENEADLTEQVAATLTISKEEASAFCKNMIIYTHGLASYIAAGLITATKPEVYEMMRQAGEGFLLQIGARLS